MRRSSGYDFVEPMILRILKDSDIALSVLAINYHVNRSIGKTINLNVIKRNLMFLMNRNKISKTQDVNGILFYKFIA